MKYANISFYVYWWWDFCCVLCFLVVSETCLCTSCTDQILNLESCKIVSYAYAENAGNIFPATSGNICV